MHYHFLCLACFGCRMRETVSALPLGCLLCYTSCPHSMVFPPRITSGLPEIFLSVLQHTCYVGCSRVGKTACHQRCSVRARPHLTDFLASFWNRLKDLPVSHVFQQCVACIALSQADANASFLVFIALWLHSWSLEKNAMPLAEPTRLVNTNDHQYTQSFLTVFSATLIQRGAATDSQRCSWRYFEHFSRAFVLPFRALTTSIRCQTSSSGCPLVRSLPSFRSHQRGLQGAHLVFRCPPTP